MVTRFGMDGDLGQMVYEPKRQSFLGDHPFTTQPKSYSEDTGREIDMAIRKLVDAAYLRAKDVLTKRRHDLQQGAELLLQKETLTPDEFPALKPIGQHDEVDFIDRVRCVITPPSATHRFALTITAMQARTSS